MDCCDITVTETILDEPQKGFLIANDCAGQRKINYPVKAGEVLVANQLVSMDNNGELVADDTVAANYIGFAGMAIDTTANPGQIPVWVEGEFDESLAVFATLDADTVRRDLARIGLYLRKRV